MKLRELEDEEETLGIIFVEFNNVVAMRGVEFEKFESEFVEFIMLLDEDEVRFTFRIIEFEFRAGLEARRAVESEFAIGRRAELEKVEACRDWFRDVVELAL